MSFAIDVRQWKTVDAFAKHLAAHDPAICSWVQGMIIHHTWRPTQSQWRGRASIEGMKAYYERLNPPWDAGPHLFIVSGSPNAADDGIWQMTPLNMVGVHAGVCNSTNWGIEVVGDYDDEPWDAATRALVVGAAAELAKWRGIIISPDTVKGHRDCNSPKSCPGKAINMQQVRDWINAEINGTPVREPITADSSILAAPRCSMDTALDYILGRNPRPAYTEWDLSVHILPAYWKLGEATGVDPCIAIAQAIHETANFSSWWALRPRRNPAGIGVTGQSSRTAPHPEEINKWAYDQEVKLWKFGLSFPSWQVSALAHMGRLCAYATKPSERTTTQHQIVNQALMMRSLPLALQGSAPVLFGLNGKWAYPGTTYAQRIAAIATEMAF